MMKLQEKLLLCSCLLLLLWTACKKDEITTPVAPPVEKIEVAFEASATSALVGTEIQFTDKSKGKPDSWKWSFPGGSPSSSSEQNPKVVYETAGNYSVSLEASNSNDKKSSAQADYISVTEGVVAKFTIDTTKIITENTVQFSDASIGNPDNWKWSFPGGTPSSSSEQNPIVQYAQPGNYDVILEVSNALSNNQISASEQITVLSGRPKLPDDLVLKVKEDAVFGDEVGIITHNFHGSEALKFEILPSYDYRMWVISETDGKLFVGENARLDFEGNRTSYQIQVRMSLVEHPEYFDLETIKFEIEDVDERPQEGLLGYYPMDGDGKDQSGNNLEALLIGNDITVSANRKGTINSALSFANGSYLSLHNNEQYKGLKEFSIGFWVNFSDADNNGYVLGLYNWDDLDQYFLKLVADATLNTMKITSWFDNNTWSNSNRGGFGGVTIDDGVWYHLRLSWNGRSWGVYLDNFSVGGTSQNGEDLNIPHIENPGFVLGSWHDDSKNFKGKIDEVRIYDRALSPTEMWQWYQEELKR